MSDDIVKRLLDEAEEAEAVGEHTEAFMYRFAASAIESRDDEIVRLRAAGDALAEESWNNRSADKAVKAWWKARCG